MKHSWQLPWRKDLALISPSLDVQAKRALPVMTRTSLAATSE
jgi:hypothetical protein